MASGSDMCSVVGFLNLEDMWIAIKKKGVELGHRGRSHTLDGHNPVLMLVQFFDLDVFSKEQGFGDVNGRA
jgi:hypothetical protein